MKPLAATLIVAGVSALVVGVLWFALCDRYRYYDYRAAGFARGQARVQVDLLGGYGPSSPTERGKPYTLVIRVRSPRPHAVSIGDVALSCASTRVRMPMRATRRTVIETAGAPPMVVYGFDGIDIPYEDCDVAGVIGLDAGASPPGAWAVVLNTDYSAQWRVRFIDRLMSV